MWPHSGGLYPLCWVNLKGQLSSILWLQPRSETLELHQSCLIQGQHRFLASFLRITQKCIYFDVLSKTKKLRLYMSKKHDETHVWKFPKKWKFCYYILLFFQTSVLLFFSSSEEHKLKALTWLQKTLSHRLYGLFSF